VVKTPQEAPKFSPRDVKRVSRDALERPKTAQEALREAQEAKL